MAITLFLFSTKIELLGLRGLCRCLKIFNIIKTGPGRVKLADRGFQTLGI